MNETREVCLREVADDDLAIFFEHQRDPEANRMAAFPAREFDAHTAHWRRILGDPTVLTRTILVDGNVAGSIASFEQAGQREVGYWIGRDYWGRSVATRALAAFLDLDQRRPLYAHVVAHNTG
ncbi:MAG: GNAT family N-acetyltransferase, partial [Vicinamibacterales bacterium]